MACIAVAQAAGIWDRELVASTRAAWLGFGVPGAVAAAGVGTATVAAVGTAEVIAAGCAAAIVVVAVNVLRSIQYATFLAAMCARVVTTSSLSPGLKSRPRTMLNLGSGPSRVQLIGL